MEALRPTAGARAGLDADDAPEIIARCTWSGIAEPGDRVAGAVVGVLGAAGALAAVVDARSADAVVGRMVDAGLVLAPDSRAALVDEVRTALDRWRPRVVRTEAMARLHAARTVGAGVLVPGDPAWPSGADDLGPHAPLVLWWTGDEQALAALSRSVAVVGARAATGYGEHVTAELASGLVDRSVEIVSGGAYGIDGVAHRAAIASGGRTVAFLAGGVDRLYPSGHAELFGRMRRDGAIVSELPCGASPTRWRFLLRNRLIAAVSSATVVVEAGARSGSLNTANHALALERPLGAVPGPVTSVSSSGCHRLIRDSGAVCITSAEEAMELVPGWSGIAGEAAGDLPPHAVASAASTGASESRGAVARLRGPGQGEEGRAASSVTARTDDPRATRVLDALSTRRGRDTSDVASRAGLGISETSSVLGRLELEGLVARPDGGWVRRPAAR
ncbi:DNA-processing protein DprA [Clavibacter michiganensis]|uniref:DNA-processing protein DprA n=1 Tax=Clavibacter michiganensis TaxID=28447 RepID=UPI003D67C27C